MTEMTRAEKERREQARKRYKAGGTWEDKKPKPKAAKGKSRKERTAELDVDKLIPMLGTLFMSKSPMETNLAFQTVPELGELATKNLPPTSLVRMGTTPKHALMQVSNPSVSAPQAMLHELVHVLQRVMRPGEPTLAPAGSSPVAQVMKQEVGAWAPQVQRGVEGGIKTIQDVSRSRSLPSYFEAHKVAMGKGGQAAKQALIEARKGGFTAAGFPSIARAAQARITPDIVEQVKRLLASTEPVKKLGPANLQALAPLGATQALRALLNLPALKGILPMLSPEKMDEIFRRVMPFSGVRG